MPLFRLTTIERWEHKVDYPLIEAATMEEAFAKIKAGDQEYLCQESIPEGDEVLRVWAADDETDSPLPIPAELEEEPPSLESLICACERMMVGINRKDTTHCEWYEGIEHDGAAEAAAIIAKAEGRRPCATP
jgi:hypothetical protein